MEAVYLAIFERFNGVVDVLVGNNAYKCTAAAHGQFDLMVLMDVAIAIIGFFVWRKFVRTDKTKVAERV